MQRRQVILAVRVFAEEMAVPAILWDRPAVQSQLTVRPPTACTIVTVSAVQRALVSEVEVRHVLAMRPNVQIFAAVNEIGSGV